VDITPIKNVFQKILLVEDDLDLREAMALYLDALGLSYFSVCNGQEATETLSREKVDVLITDFAMPKMNGVELLEWCRAKGFHFPVIFISANADLLNQEKIALEDCCATLMQKPINLKVLGHALEAALLRNHHADCVHSRSSPVMH